MPVRAPIRLAKKYAHHRGTFLLLARSIVAGHELPPHRPGQMPGRHPPPTARQIDIARWIPSTQRAIFRWAFNIPQYSGSCALSRALMHDPPANIALHNTTTCTYIGFRDQERSEQDRKKTKDEENGIYEAVISELAQISQHMQRAWPHVGPRTQRYRYCPWGHTLCCTPGRLTPRRVPKNRDFPDHTSSHGPGIG